MCLPAGRENAASRPILNSSVVVRDDTAQERGGMRSMKWVLNTYQTAQDWETERIIEVCRAAGYEGIEFLQDFNQRHGLEADASPEHVAAIKKKMQEAGLIVASLTSCRHFHDPEEEQRRDSIAQVK